MLFEHRSNQTIELLCTGLSSGTLVKQLDRKYYNINMFSNTKIIKLEMIKWYLHNLLR
jgi:hypothetical protein